MAIDTSDFTFQGIGFVDTVGIPGCTDSTATNYDANATINDGSCIAGTGLFTFIPDYNFRDKLHPSYSVSDWYDTDGGEIVGVVAGKWCLTSDINTVTNLDISSSDISDLTGIEDFTALTELRCYYNQLTSLDLSANLALTNLYCFSNQLTSLDLSQNIALTQLFFANNQLTSLDVSANLALTSLYCNNNQLTTLDVSTNTALTVLACRNNQLITLDVSDNTVLDTLECNDNNLTSLDVRNGNNTNFTNFISTNNPNLYCISVDDPIYSAANWTNIDDQHYFAANC